MADLTYSGAAITPHDVAAHGYKFGYHSDWREKNDHLIDLVWQRHKNGKSPKPNIYHSPVVVPDVRVKRFSRLEHIPKKLQTFWTGICVKTRN